MVKKHKIINMKPALKLKNKYTGEFVYCRNTEDVLNHGNGYIFYRVFRKETPDRIYLVNRDAYIIVD